MTAVDARIIELVITGAHRPLNLVEAREWEESRRYVINREWRLARVMNLLRVAYMSRDWDWMEQLDQERQNVLKLY